MTEVSFYHLTARPVESALPRLLERTLESNYRAVVIAFNDERVDMLNDLLWTYDSASWLPHGAKKELNPLEQPIWLTNKDENPNNASFLFLVDGAESNQIASYDRVFELFDGRDEEALARARLRWQTYKNEGFLLAYWQQESNGRWTKVQ